MSHGGKRIEYIDAFRFFGILLMVMGHIGFGETFDHFIHAFHVPMFFFASGLFFNSDRTIREDFSIRCRTLIFPYIFFGAFNYVVWILLNPTENPYMPLRHLVFINTWGLPIAGALWFLTALFFTVIIYRILFKLLGKKQLLLAVVILSLTGCLVKGHVLPYALNAALVGIGLYHSGAELSRCKKLYNKVTNLNAFIIIAMGIASVWLIFVNGYINMRNGDYAIIPLFWLNALLACVVGLNIARRACALIRQTSVSKYVIRYMESVGHGAIIYICLNQLLIEVVFNRQTHQGVRAGLIILFLTMIFLRALSIVFTHTGLACIVGRDNPNGKQCRTVLAMGCFFLVGLILWIHPIADTNDTSESGKHEAAHINEALLTSSDYDDADMLIHLMQSHMNYLLDEQWNSANIYAFSKASNINQAELLTSEQQEEIETSQKSFMNWQDEEYLNIAGYKKGLENAIRPWAHLCYCSAIELRFGVYTGKDTKISYEEAEGKTLKLIASLARRHVSNDKEGWGDTWQSALWAENIGFAAWLMRDKLSETDRKNIKRMVVYEANRFLNYDVPYYQDRNNDVLHEGDTKGEENAWNSRILALASCIFPNHANRSEWEDKMTELLVSSSSIPEEWKSLESVDGFPLSRLNGSNINADGTVTNHGVCHVDYSSTIAEGMIESALIFALAGLDIPKSSTHNIDKLYNALVNVDLGRYDASMSNKYFYARKDGMPAAEVNMPGENDWGGNWYASYYLMDTEAEVFHLDTGCPPNCKAADWADLHLKKLSEMAARETKGRVTGCFFQPGENFFVSGESYQLHNLCKAYLLRKISKAAQL